MCDTDGGVLSRVSINQDCPELSAVGSCDYWYMFNCICMYVCVWGGGGGDEGYVYVVLCSVCYSWVLCVVLVAIIVYAFRS